MVSGKCYISYCSNFLEFALKINAKLRFVHRKQSFTNCGVLCNLVPFVQFKNREKHPLKKSATLPWMKPPSSGVF